ncbi:DUF4145 domain-containing protein [Virgibacillus oceani]
MAEKNYSNIAQLCLHCGNETILEIKSVVKDEEYEIDADDYGREFLVATFYTTYTLYKCPVCNKVTLKSLEASDIEIGPDGKPYDYKNTLYPVQTGELSSFPSEIRSAYESALKTRNIDSVICAIGLRRTLEILCYDQGEKEGSLQQKLNRLSERGVIPKVLDEASHLIRTIGNSAAHDVDVNFDTQIINDMIRFTRIILDYVYVIPKEIIRIQSHFDNKVLTQKGQKSHQLD